MLAPQVHKSERKNLKLESQRRPVYPTDLGSRRTDKNGVGCLDTHFGTGVAGFFLCFAEEIGLEPILPHIGQPFNKNLFVPHHFWCYACVQRQAAESYSVRQQFYRPIIVTIKFLA